MASKTQLEYKLLGTKPSKIKSETINLRITASQKEALQALAAAEGRGVSNYLIWKLGLDKTKETKK